VRAEMNLTFATELVLVLVGVSAETAARAERWPTWSSDCRDFQILRFPKIRPHGLQLVVRGEVVALPLARPDRCRSRTGAA